jgi:hypothetical protein
MSRFSTLLVAGICLNLFACGEGQFKGKFQEQRRIANADLDLEGEACTPEAEHGDASTYRMCASGDGVQFCRGDEEWSFCDLGDGCVEGDTMQTPYYEGDGCSGLTGTCVNYEGVTRWEFPNCATPLVLSFDEAPVTYTAYTGNSSVAAFDVGGAECTTNDWPAASNPWLALDRDGNGRIDGGEELFGSGTRLENGRRAAHGFEALSELDENHDGKVDERDPAFSRLVLWADHNGDRQSQAQEISPLSSSEVTALSVDFREQVQCDERGNCGRERAAFEFAGTRSSQLGEIVDVYLPCH